MTKCNRNATYKSRRKSKMIKPHFTSLAQIQIVHRSYHDCIIQKNQYYTCVQLNVFLSLHRLLN